MMRRGAALATLFLTGLLAGGCGGAPKPATDPLRNDTANQMRLAQSLWRAGRVSEALEALDAAIAADPDDARVYNFYGQICFRTGRHAEAEAKLRRALEIDPHLTDAHNNLGSLYTEMGEPAKAETEFRAALSDSAYPTPEKVYLNLGLLYVSQGRDEEAIAALRRSVELDPKYNQAHFELAQLLERTGGMVEAAREYEVAEPAFRNSGDYWYRRGMTYYRLGDTQKALDSLVRVRTVAPGSESAAQAEQLLELLD
jgi:type IV pilus biogenesis/stability protein PilW